MDPSNMASGEPAELKFPDPEIYYQLIQAAGQAA